MPTIHEQLRKVSRDLDAVSSEAACEARLILAHVYGTTPGALIMRLLHEGSHEEEIASIVAARLGGRPLAYILNSRDFYGAEYFVDERVLIPRADTESVVEAALTRLERRRFRTAADICCGSGCIGITLLRESPVETVFFADISAGALAVAAANAVRLAPGRNAVFLQGDLTDPLPQQVDMIICNPPYITAAEMEELELQVRDYEPHLALYGGQDGLDFYRRLVREGPARLTPGGLLITEIGAAQRGGVETLFRQAGLKQIEAGVDLAGRPRWVAGSRSLGEDDAGETERDS